MNNYEEGNDMNADQEKLAERATEIWRVLFILIMGAMVGITGWGIHQVTGSIESVAAKQDTFYFNFQTYILGMERRVTAVEDYEKAQDNDRLRLERDFDNYRNAHERDRADRRP